MISKIIRNIAKLFWFLPGFLLWAAFPPMGERMDVLFALAPLMWMSRRETSASLSAWRWFQSGIFYWIATLSWMPAIIKNGGPWPLVVLGWFVLAAYCAGYFAAFGYLSVKVWTWARGGGYVRRIVGITILEPLLWCGLELVRSRLFGGFAWNQLGVVPINSGFGAPAALGGVYLCSAIVVLINGTIAGIAERVWKPERSGFAALRKYGTLETILAFAFVYGVYAASPRNVIDEDAKPLKVALIQRNFPCVFKNNEENPYAVYEKLLSNLTNLDIDLVVLPESAMCEFSPIDQQGAVRFADYVRVKTGASLLAGGTRFKEGLTYNSAALYEGKSIQVYDKVHLVPFGEYIPGDKLIPVLQNLAPVGSCTPGEIKLLNYQKDNLPIGTAICYEDTDSALIREYAAKGAQLLCFITNDSWFSYSTETEQHSWQAVARAIETGLPIVRVGNSGVSGTIMPDGKTSWLIGSNGRPLTDHRGTMFDAVRPVKGVLTPYVRIGDWPLGIAFSLLILSMILVKCKDNYEKRRILSV